MPEDTNQTSASTNSGTPEAPVTPTASPNVNAANTSSSSQQANEGSNQPQVYIPDATKQKYSKLESENETYKKEVEAAKSERETLNEIRGAFKNSPAVYEAFRAEYNRTHPGSNLTDHNSIYGNKTTDQTTGGNQNSNSTDDYSKFEQFSGLNKFLEAKPNYNPSKAKDADEAADRNLVLNSIAQKASKIKQSNPYISTDEAFSQAEQSLAGLVTGGNSAIENAKKIGEIGGRQGAYSVGAATGGISGGDSPRDEKEAIDYSKFSESQQAHIKSIAKKDPKRAERVARLTLKDLE